MLLKFSKLLFVILIITSCEQDLAVEMPDLYEPTIFIFEIPEGFPPPKFPADNPLTVEGISLGKKLFHDPILSGNNTMSCADCHFQNHAFSEPAKVSIGIDGIPGEFNASALINLAWNTAQFWDGRTITLEEQALDPVVSPIELHSISWKQVVEELSESKTYVNLFKSAFGTEDFDSTHVVKAIAQFERTLVSSNSKFDKVMRYEAAFTPSEIRGKEIFDTEKGDCFHCHAQPLFTNNQFMNNGLDTDEDMHLGRMNVSGDIYDKGKFKTPTLRNIELTAPYMHDGRFETLEEVIEHYDFGGHQSNTVDPLMKKIGIGLGLTDQDKIDLINFLKTLTDSSFVTNQNYSLN